MTFLDGSHIVGITASVAHRVLCESHQLHVYEQIRAEISSQAISKLSNPMAKSTNHQLLHQMITERKQVAI